MDWLALELEDSQGYTGCAAPDLHAFSFGSDGPISAPTNTFSSSSVSQDKPELSKVITGLQTSLGQLSRALEEDSTTRNIRKRHLEGDSVSDDEHERKKLDRKEKNRQSAQQSRDRQKARMQELEERLITLENSNRMLTQNLQMQAAENFHLRQQLSAFIRGIFPIGFSNPQNAPKSPPLPPPSVPSSLPWGQGHVLPASTFLLFTVVLVASAFVGVIEVSNDVSAVQQIQDQDSSSKQSSRRLMQYEIIFIASDGFDGFCHSHQNSLETLDTVDETPMANLTGSWLNAVDNASSETS